MKDVIDALIRTIKEATQNGDKTILFPVSDAKLIVDTYEKSLCEHNRGGVVNIVTGEYTCWSCGKTTICPINTTDE